MTSYLTVFLIVVVAGQTDVRHHHHCPSCRLHNQEPAAAAAVPIADTARLESIKRQILVKLGLNAKPNVSSIPPRDFILETLLRAEESVLEPSSPQRASSVLHRSDESSTFDSAVLEDDFYGKTSEIIAFAEPGESGRLYRPYSYCRSISRSSMHVHQRHFL